VSSAGAPRCHGDDDDDDDDDDDGTAGTLPAETPQLMQVVYVLHTTLGNAYLTAGAFEDALPLYKEAIRICPEDSSAPVQLALAYDKLSDRDGGPWPARSLELKRSNARKYGKSDYLVHYNLGCELRTQQPMAFTEARKCFEAALQCSRAGKKDADTWAMLGVTRLDETVMAGVTHGVADARDTLTEAIAVLEQALKLDPHHPAATRNLERARDFAAGRTAISAILPENAACSGFTTVCFNDGKVISFGRHEEGHP